ncbi:hypothetical protein M8J75_005714 [Diaphorina citri]|nr:hypothetical protein M8J75_005714 [Diaphorina citri]
MIMLYTIFTLVSYLSSTSLSINVNEFDYAVKSYIEDGIFEQLEYKSSNKDQDLLLEYDFIIVGAGPGGCTVANRLSEIPHWKILLLEAGHYFNYLVDIPVLNTNLILSPLNWGYKTEKEDCRACLGLKGQRCPWPSGKGVGGTSLINTMLYTRGNKRNYDDWAKLGNYGWSYNEVLPYFKKAERIQISELQNSSYHGTQGFIGVDYTEYNTPMLDAFLQAGMEAGYPLVDYNGKTQTGFARAQATLHKRSRRSSAKDYIDPIKKRCNLTVKDSSFVKKILIDPVTKKACGVLATIKGIDHKILARKEVILSAGAFNSPKLLMLSGIGPQEHLNDLNIPVIKNLRVGENLQEHLAMAGLTFLVNQPIGLLQDRLIKEMPKLFPEWYFEGKGKLTMLGCEGLAYVNTKYNVFPDDLPDIEFIFTAVSLASDGGVSLRQEMGITDHLYNSVYSSVDRKDSWSIWPMILYPRSRGKVLLKDSHPLTPPLIHANFFNDTRDLDVIVEGIKMAIELSKTKAFQSIGSTLHKAPIPGCSQYTFGSDAYWGCSVRHITTQLHHQCGTCKMGPRWDSSAVVDPQLKVYGVDNLRVVDASIIPVIPGGHTVAVVYMIAEKASDMIKKTWLPNQ